MGKYVREIEHRPEIQLRDGRWRYPLINILTLLKGFAEQTSDYSFSHVESWDGAAPHRVTATIRENVVLIDSRGPHAAYLDVQMEAERRALTALGERSSAGEWLLREEGILLLAGTRAFREIKNDFKASALSLAQDHLRHKVYGCTRAPLIDAFLIWDPMMNAVHGRNSVIGVCLENLRYRFIGNHANSELIAWYDSEKVYTEAAVEIMRDVWKGYAEDLRRMMPQRTAA